MRNKKTKKQNNNKKICKNNFLCRIVLIVNMYIFPLQLLSRRIIAVLMIVFLGEKLLLFFFLAIERKSRFWRKKLVRVFSAPNKFRKLWRSVRVITIIFLIRARRLVRFHKIILAFSFFLVYFRLDLAQITTIPCKHARLTNFQRQRI